MTRQRSVKTEKPSDLESEIGHNTTDSSHSKYMFDDEITDNAQELSDQLKTEHTEMPDSSDDVIESTPYETGTRRFRKGVRQKKKNLKKQKVPKCSSLNEKPNEKQPNKICRSRLKVSQSESFLSGLNYSASDSDKSINIKREITNNSPEFDTTQTEGPASFDVIESSLFGKQTISYSDSRKRKKRKTHLVEDINCSNNTHHSTDCDIVDMNDIDTPDKTLKRKKRKDSNQTKKIKGENSESNSTNSTCTNGSMIKTESSAVNATKISSSRQQKGEQSKNFEVRIKLKSFANSIQESKVSSVQNSLDLTDLNEDTDLDATNIKSPEILKRKRRKSKTTEEYANKQSGSEVDVSDQKCKEKSDEASTGPDESSPISRKKKHTGIKKKSASDDIKENTHPEDDMLLENELEKYFREREFKRDFKVAKLHRIADRASNLTSTQRAQIAANGIKVKMGKFTKVEDDQIQENWRHFIEVYGIEDKPHMFFCMNRERVTIQAKKNFIFYLSRGFPNRTPFCVFKRFKLIMDRINKGRFSKEEDDYILKAMNSKHKKSVTEVAKHLHRSLLSVSCHMSKLRNAYSRKIKWSGKNAACFIKYLLKVTHIDEKNIAQLKNRQITTLEWSKLSKKLDGVPVRVLKPVWLCNLHPALFIQGSSCDLAEVKWKLTKSLYENNETDWICVDWNKYVPQFEGFTTLKLYILLKQLVKTHVPDKKQDNLRKCLKHLIKNKMHLAVQPIKPLYKIKYKNGEIQEMKPK